MNKNKIKFKFEIHFIINYVNLMCKTIEFKFIIDK